jgi:alanyl-tRNA synthetase
MLGNWSLGDYFKKEAINWSYEFLTSKDEGLGLDPNRLYVTVFEGDSIAPRDEEASTIWQEIFKKNKIEGNRIFYLPADKNWWEAGDNGPCGPDTEMYYDVSNKFGGKGLTHEEFLKADDVRDVVEIWNDVFMQYEKKDGKIIGKLPKPSVDTGAGLERLCMTLQGVDNIYDTDLLRPVINKIKECSKKWDIKSARIIADHIRASAFLISDGVEPSNSDRGYVLRKLLRRAIRQQKTIQLEILDLSKFVSDFFVLIYPELKHNESNIVRVFREERGKFTEILHAGDFEIVDLIKIAIKEKRTISGKEAFTLYSSYGFPIEETIQIAKIDGVEVDLVGFNEEFKKHQELSRAGAEQKFKGGLADNSEQVVRYHTTTHLLHQALHDVLGEGVGQKGSNITSERLRFDFSYPQKMTSEQIKKVEEIVNEKIKAKLPVNKVIMPIEDAEKTGARHFFGEKYGDEVSIYYIGDTLERAYSKEFCGGPHVANTSELNGTFKISKEEAVSAGVRRIKAVLV